ncbi:hypothetical protein LJC34_00640 [Oscillospiraceae bacterium OttesenSCG-928-G22]|nr:hypothetical protein [Oscillospiraceae bacterium OttesenSCG-928-G22]
MSDVKQCRRCNKLYMYRGTPYCPDCVQKLDELFVTVREYLFDNPNASIESVSEATGATALEIENWLREGRLIVSSGTTLIQCENCGKPISTGRYCDNCAKNVRDALQSGAQAIEGRQGAKDFVKRAPKDTKSKGMHINIEKK